MTEVCGSCALALGKEDSVYCYGACIQAFHMKCTGLDRSASKIFKSCSNIKWVCNDCLKTDQPHLTNEIKTSFSEEIKTEINNAVAPFLSVAKTMQEFMPKVMELVSQKPSYKDCLDIKSYEAFPAINQRNSGRRDRSPERMKNDITPNYGALFRDKLVFGKAESSTSKITGVKVVARPPPSTRPDTRKIFVSRLEPTTSCADIIEHLMSKKLIDDANDIICTKLVKKDANLGELTFVSFKLDVPERLFVAINNPLMWPDSVAIREFVDTPARPRAVATISKKARDSSQSPKQSSPLNIENSITQCSPQRLITGAGEGEAELIEINLTLDDSMNIASEATSKN